MIDLVAIYHAAIAACSPERLARAAVTPDLPGAVVAIGKCAGRLFDGVSAHAQAGFVAVPHGYPHPSSAAGVEIVEGGHPQFDEGSFVAGARLVDFVESHEDILFLVSGGGSACVEVARPPFRPEDLIRVNATLLRSGLPIEDVNAVRQLLSGIKGGRLGARVRGRAVTLVYSDVSSGELSDVASGPTMPPRKSAAEAIAILERTGCGDVSAMLLRATDCPGVAEADARLLADNDTLTEAAARHAEASGLRAHRAGRQVEVDVQEAAELLARLASSLEAGEVLVAGGEVTVPARGDGQGGRCTELAARFALAAPQGVEALFAGSDGVDGTSGMAGAVISAVGDGDLREAIVADLTRSDSAATVRRIGQPIMMRPTGNNLRDLYLLARR